MDFFSGLFWGFCNGALFGVMLLLFCEFFCVISLEGSDCVEGEVICSVVVVFGDVMFVAGVLFLVGMIIGGIMLVSSSMVF